MKKTFPFIFVFFITACAIHKKEDTVPYAVGFRVIHATDTTRIYKPGSPVTDYLHFRPLDIDIWYPADSITRDTALLFRDILGLLPQRANYYTASLAGNGMLQQIAQMCCDYFKCSDTSRVLNFKSNSYRDAIAATGHFPLVVYLAAYNGMSYENFILFETLARNGFVVASISSIGRFPGDMTMKAEDLEEQVSDALASIKILKTISEVDTSRIGLVGYSWGGLAATEVAGKIPGVTCLASLDGSEYHHYGESKEEDADFDGIRNSMDFRNMKLSMPYLRLESSPGSASGKSDSVYHFPEKLTAAPKVFLIDSARHEDFSCLPYIVKKSGNCPDDHRYERITELVLSYLEQEMKGMETFAETVRQDSGKITPLP